MVEMFETGDIDNAADVIASSYLDHQGLGGEPLHGSEGFAQVVDVVQLAFPELRISLLGHVGDEHNIAALLEWTYSCEAGTTTRRTLEWLMVRDGQATEHRGVSVDTQ